MDDMRSSFSRMKKGLKHRLGGKKLASDRPEDKATGERVDSSASLLRPDPRAAESGHDEKRSGISTGVLQAHPREPSPQPEPMPADEGRGDPKGKEADVDRKEASRRHSRLGPDVEVAPGSGPSQEVQRASSPLPFTSTPSKQEPDSTWLPSPQLLCLIIPFTMQTPLPFLIICRKTFALMKILNPAPPRTRRGRVGSLPPLPPLNYSSAE